jgi:predicted permease
MRQIGQLDLGIRQDHALVFEIHLPDARYDGPARAAFYEDFAARVRALPGVEAAGGVSKLPATGPYHQWGTTALSGPLANTREGHSSLVQQRVVSGDYFGAAGIPILAGRAFGPDDDAKAPRRLIVSKSLAVRFFPGLDAVGQRLTVSGRDGVIVGVAGDVAVTAEGDQGLYVYHSHRQMADDRNWPLTQVVRTGGSIETLRRDTRTLLAALDPQLVMYDPSTLADAIGRGEAQRVFTLRMLAAFAGTALALSAIGLFGVLAYGVRLRAHEFGLRMALGAGAAGIRRLVLARGLALVGAGAAIGLAGAVALSGTMRALVFRVSPLDPAVLAGTTIFLLAVAGAAAYLPARRATSVEPRTLLQ